MNLHTFVIGEGETEKEYQMIQLDAFKANMYLLKLKGKIGKAMSGGLESEASNLMSLIDEKTIEEIVFPLMRDCALTCTSDKTKLDGKEGMNKLFTADTLDDFYLVAWEVVKFNFGPFISKMAKNLFGLELTEVSKLMKEKMKEVGKSGFATISTQNTGSGAQ